MQMSIKVTHRCQTGVVMRRLCISTRSTFINVNRYRIILNMIRPILVYEAVAQQILTRSRSDSEANKIQVP